MAMLAETVILQEKKLVKLMVIIFFKGEKISS